MSGTNYFLAFLVYVDDILVTGSSENEISQVKDFLDQKFTIKDLRYAKYFLGLEISRSATGIFVNQWIYVLDLVQSTCLMGCKAASTPLPKNSKTNNEDGELLRYPRSNSKIVGKLLYLGFTRPDLAFVTQQLSQFVQSPRTTHWKYALLVLRQ